MPWFKYIELGGIKKRKSLQMLIYLVKRMTMSRSTDSNSTRMSVYIRYQKTMLALKQTTTNGIYLVVAMVFA